jgi:MFS transporter, FHS family, L-fucose permease
MAAPIIPITKVISSVTDSTVKTRSALLLVFAVFFILGGVTNINDVLIPKLKGLFQLTHFQANLVQFAFFTSYAIFSIPAGLLMARLGYTRGFVVGFLIIAAASLLFLPAAYSGTYSAFLLALFLIGGGITLLQVAMNPVTMALGPPATASSRLTFAQLFNSIGVFLMVYGGAEIMLGKTSAVDPKSLSGAQLNAFRVAETTVVGHAYIGLAIVMTAIALLFWCLRGALDGQQASATKVSGPLSLFVDNIRVRFGALCIFTYVGAEVAIGSNLISYLQDEGVMD